MNTTVLLPPASGPRRRHSAEFKAQVIAACLQPGVSIAAVALANQLNSNFLRSWVKAHRDQQESSVPASRRIDPPGSAPTTLVPVTLKAADATPSDDIQIEIRRPQTVYQITWPTSQATACAHWLREVLR